MLIHYYLVFLFNFTSFFVRFIVELFFVIYYCVRTETGVYLLINFCLRPAKTGGGYVFGRVCIFLSVHVDTITQKVLNRFWWYFQESFVMLIERSLLNMSYVGAPKNIELGIEGSLLLNEWEKFYQAWIFIRLCKYLQIKVIYPRKIIWFVSVQYKRICSTY